MDFNKENLNKKRLGRGIGSLLGSAVTESQSEATVPAESVQLNTENMNENRVWNISIDKIVPGLYQPRKNFNKESLAELAKSIKENGILQPIAVRKRKEGGFEIIASERR